MGSVGPGMVKGRGLIYRRTRMYQYPREASDTARENPNQRWDN